MESLRYISVAVNIILVVTVFFLIKKNRDVEYKYNYERSIYNSYIKEKDSIILSDKKKYDSLYILNNELEKKIISIKYKKIKDEKIINNANIHTLDSLWSAAGY